MKTRSITFKNAEEVCDFLNRNQLLYLHNVIVTSCAYHSPMRDMINPQMLWTVFYRSDEELK